MYPECIVLVSDHSHTPKVFLDEAAARTYLTRVGHVKCADTFDEFASNAGYTAYYCNMYG